jgi:DNA-directed RNA polymerase specialized sigma24 family protein
MIDVLRTRVVRLHPAPGRGAVLRRVRGEALSPLADCAARGTFGMRAPGGEGRQKQSRTAAEGMTTLDTRLYAWLGEPHEQRFTRAFNAYYSLAYPALLRRLARLSRWDLAQLEEIAQDALLRFFERAGRQRREASDSVNSRLAELRPVPLGELHARRAQGWSSDVQAFRKTVMSFRPPVADADAAWKGEIRTHGAAIPGLQHRGWMLLDEVRHGLLGESDASTRTPHSFTSLDAGWLEEHLTQFLKDFSIEDERARAAEARLPGCQAFLGGVHNINLKLPLLRIPTNGLLFEIALSIYLDECRRRGRLKRGGSMSSASAGEGPLDALYDAPGLEPEVEGVFEGTPVRGTADAWVGASEAVELDEETRLEQHDVLAKFYEYLRAPLDRALERCAREHASAAAERRVAKMTRKFDLMMEVLTLIGEGYTQVEAAELLGLSRSQVKYVVESVQQAYEQFVSGALADTAAGVMAER